MSNFQFVSVTSQHISWDDVAKIQDNMKHHPGLDSLISNEVCRWCEAVNPECCIVREILEVCHVQEVSPDTRWDDITLKGGSGKNTIKKTGLDDIWSDDIHIDITDVIPGEKSHYSDNSDNAEAEDESVVDPFASEPVDVE